MNIVGTLSVVDPGQKGEDDNVQIGMWNPLSESLKQNQHHYFKNKDAFKNLFTQILLKSLTYLSQSFMLEQFKSLWFPHIHQAILVEVIASEKSDI